MTPVRRILLVEDEALIAWMTAKALSKSGFDVIGPADRLESAMELAKNEPLDAAVLDVYLAGVEAWPVAALLKERGIPFVFVTGYGSTLRPPPFCQDVPCLSKPFKASVLAQALLALVEGPGLLARHDVQP